jgi:galactofuranose transport system permease protein
MKAALNRKYLPLVVTFIVFLIVFATGGALFKGFFSLRVVLNLFTDNAFLGLCAIGETFVIISGGIDLSVGAMVAFSATLVASMTQLGHVSPWIVIPLVFVIGATFGFLHGCVIHFFKAPPFIVTLAGMFLARGLAFVVSLSSIPVDDAFINKLSLLALPLGDGVQITFSAFLFLLVVLVAIYVGGYTRFGRYIYAVGGSEQSALLMGLPVGRTKIAIYTLSGFLSSLAGVVFTVYTLSGNASQAMGLEMDAIASVVIGGTLLTGGFGFAAGTMIGVLIQGLIQTIISFQGTLDVSWTKIFVGGLLLAFILLQKIIATGAGLGRKRDG